MTSYGEGRVKLTNTQINKLISAVEKKILEKHLKYLRKKFKMKTAT